MSLNSKTANLSPEELEEAESRNNSFKFKSNLKFLIDHNGVRPGEFHTIIGPKGGSKSTLLRTVICEFAFQMKRTLVILSEEPVVNYARPINHVIKKCAKPGTEAGFLNSVIFYSELEISEEIKQNFWEWLKITIVENEIEVLVLDNFTTSFLGRSGVKQEGDNIFKLRELADKMQIPIISVHHTLKGTNVNKQVIDGDATRGNATAVNLGAYNYVVTTLFHLDKPRTFLLTDKARYHSRANKKYYELNFDSELEIFNDCIRSDLKSLMAAMQDQVKKNEGEKSYGKKRSHWQNDF